MAGEIIMTVVGNLTADPELRYTQNGKGVANFTVASTPRFFDKGSNEWKDGEATFLRCSVWGDVADNVAASLVKGTRVIVTGRYKQRPYEDREGNKRTSTELEVDEIGPSLRYATAAVQRIQRDGRAPSAYQQAQEEVWATPQDTPLAPPPGQEWVSPNDYGDETPF
jgi:single-strand DNA-binding protein